MQIRKTYSKNGESIEMEMTELTPHLEELKRVLEDKIDDKKLVDELNTYINVYHLDIESAKRGIVRKYGGASIGFVTAESIKKKIGDLTGSEQNVDILAKVVYVEKKEIQVRGEKKTIVSGILGDETSTASFTVWEGASCDLDKGSVYLFKNCYIKTWNEKIQINLGNRGAIEKTDDTMDLPERNISYSSSEVKIGDLREGIGNVTVVGRLLSVETRNVTIKGEQKVVYSGIIADDTGKVQFSAWKDFELREGETISATNAYIRGWKGIPQLNLGDRTEVSRVDDTFHDPNLGGTTVRTVGDIVRTGGGLDITLSGTIVDLRLGSGLIKRCPECNRSVLNDECVAHGKITPTLDLRIKMVVDDGTGAISAVVNRECTEKLTEITLKMATDLAKARGDSDIITKSMAERILIKHVTIRGNVMSDDYGPMMIVKEADIDDVNIAEEAAKLLATVEGSL